MTQMITEIYEALLEAGSTSDKAIKAAVAVAGVENKTKDIESELKLLRWMITATLGGVGVLLAKAFI